METFEKQLLAFQNLYHVTEIPFFILSTTGAIVAAFPEDAKSFYQIEYWQTTPLGDIKDKHPNEPTLFEVGEFCYVAVIKLDTNLYITTVPIRASTQFPHSFFPVLTHGIHPDKQVEFYRFLIDIPAKNTYQLAEFASLCKMIYCYEPTTGINIHPFTHNIAPSHSENLNFRLTAEDLHSEKHVALDYEKNILNAITQGDESALQYAMNRSIYGSIGRMSLNEIRQARYEFICMVFAACRAAITGGLPEETAFTLSDSMCQKMDSMSTIEEINKYSKKCMLELCRQVHNNSQSNHHSSYTKACCDYINEHLFEPLTVDNLSIKIGLNRKSLNQYFKNDMGVNLSEYILNKRLSEAAYMLTNSDMSICAIGELLQFSSQSHFTDKFKKQYGITPLQYRLNK